MKNAYIKMQNKKKVAQLKKRWMTIHGLSQNVNFAI